MKKSNKLIKLLTLIMCLAVFTSCSIKMPDDVARENFETTQTITSVTQKSENKISIDNLESPLSPSTDDLSKYDDIQTKSESTTKNEPKNNYTQKQTEQSVSTTKKEDKKISIGDLDNSDNNDLSKYDMEENKSTTNKNKTNNEGDGWVQTEQTWDHYNDKDFDFEDANGDGRDDKTGLDKYLTDPIPVGKPNPVEPEDSSINKNNVKHITLSIRMDTILDNLDMLDEELMFMITDDEYANTTGKGVIMQAQQVYFYEGESVMDVLLRETQARRIHMEFSFTPMYNSHYVEGIHNFYEFSTGELSGWMYSVNGWYPNYGASRYKLKDGDVVEWNYTCDLGRDLPGGEWLGGLS